MPRRAKRKIKDLVEMLEDPDNSGYIGDYDDMIYEEELLDSEEDFEDQEDTD